MSQVFRESSFYISDRNHLHTSDAQPTYLRDFLQSQSTILMLVSPRDELFVEAMLKLIPSTRPVIIIRTGRSDILGALQLMICTFYLSIDICAPRGINPFSPGAPSWGGKLWALKLGAEKRE